MPNSDRMLGDAGYAVANKLRMLREMGIGAGETALSLGSSMAAKPIAGLSGLYAGAKELRRSHDFGSAGQAARDAIADTQESGSYAPRSDVGSRGVENVNSVVEPISTTLRQMFVDPYGDLPVIGPTLGAGMLAATELIGPKGKARAGKPHPTKLITEPNSPQGVLPGVEPLTPQQALATAVAARLRAKEAANFDTPSRHFQYNPGARQYDVTAHFGESEDGTRMRTAGPHGSEMTHQMPDVDELYARGAHETAERMIDKHEAVQNADADVLTAKHGVVQENIGNETAEIQRLREQAAAEQDPARRTEIEREIYHAIRNKPIADDAGAWRAPPSQDVRPPRQYDYDAVVGERRPPPGDLVVGREQQLMDQQRSLVEALREQRAVEDFTRDPEYEQPSWVQQLEAQHPGNEGTLIRRHPTKENSLPAKQSWWEDYFGVGPDSMRRDSVDAFLKEARKNPDILQYGTMPPGVSDIEDMAEAMGKRTGKRIRIDKEGSVDPDDYEPETIEQPKTHGRGEVMRNEYGDYKEEERTHDRGDSPMYDDRGDVKKVEVKGPPIEGEEAVYAKRRAEGGEPKRDDSGDQQYDYIKSEGGEKVRDERGRVKYEEVDNPDYGSRGSDNPETMRLSVPNEGEIKVTYDADEPASVYAMRGGDVGSLLYQTLLGAASKTGETFGPASSLTSVNQLRLLNNSLANWVRTGENPRDVAGTAAGKSTALEGYAKGPELWRALSESARERVRRAAPEDENAKVGGNPDAVTFHPERGFEIHGKAVDDPVAAINANIEELSPGLVVPPGMKTSSTGVGATTLMKKAVFDWVRRASPDEAVKVAREWKRFGPIFAVAGVSLSDVKNMIPETETEN